MREKLLNALAAQYTNVCKNPNEHDKRTITGIAL